MKSNDGRTKLIEFDSREKHLGLDSADVVMRWESSNGRKFRVIAREGFGYILSELKPNPEGHFLHQEPGAGNEFALTISGPKCDTLKNNYALLPPDEYLSRLPPPLTAADVLIQCDDYDPDTKMYHNVAEAMVAANTAVQGNHWHDGSAQAAPKVDYLQRQHQFWEAQIAAFQESQRCLDEVRGGKVCDSFGMPRQAQEKLLAFIERPWFDTWEALSGHLLIGNVIKAWEVWAIYGDNAPSRPQSDFSRYPDAEEFMHWLQDFHQENLERASKALRTASHLLKIRSITTARIPDGADWRWH